VISCGEKRTLKFECENCRHTPEIGKNTPCLKEIIEKISETAKIDSLVLNGKYVHEYTGENLELLKEFSSTLQTSKYLIRKNITPTDCQKCKSDRKEKVVEIWSKLKKSPKEGLKDLKQLKHENSEKISSGAKKCQKCRKIFQKESIIPAQKLLSKTKLIEKLETSKEDIKDLLNPAIRPRFLRSKIKKKKSPDLKLKEAYEIGKTEVRIYYRPEKLEHVYFLIPPEYKLPPKEIEILLKVRNDLLEKKGSLKPDIAREQIRKSSKNKITETSLEKNINLKEERIEELSKIITKYTAGFGLIETLLQDKKIQDIYVDAPVGKNPIYVHHQNYEECFTNAYITPEDAEILTSRFRAISGRPFSKSSPSLDLNWKNIRIAAIDEPLSPKGLALAVRRHKSTPWTLPLFIKKNFMTPEAAGLLSLMIDSQASILITGSRGAGKTSLLSALLLEILPKYRILCIEDTAELPIQKLRTLGYKAQRLQIKSSVSNSEVEIDAERALRTALRLGESVLAIGEVRGPETKALYEAMRVGAAGNAVLGTIHGSSTRDVFERVVYDLDIPPSSFKATDLIAVARPIREKGGVDRERRLTQITEVGDEWENNPVKENGFNDLMSYNSNRGEIEATGILEGKKSDLFEMISKKWDTEKDQIFKNFKTRKKIFDHLVKEAESKQEDVLKAKFVLKSNIKFHKILEDEIKNGGIDFDEIYLKWRKWFNGVE